MALAGTILHAVLEPIHAAEGPAWFTAAMRRLAETRTVVSLPLFRSWCGVSDAYLSRTMRLHGATTVRELLVQHSLQLAARALLARDSSIATIAAVHGFATPQPLPLAFSPALRRRPQCLAGEPPLLILLAKRED